MSLKYKTQQAYLYGLFKSSVFAFVISIISIIPKYSVCYVKGSTVSSCLVYILETYTHMNIHFNKNAFQ